MKSRGRHLSKSRLSVFAACILLIGLSGCYLLNQGRGQLDLRFSQIPIEKALEQESNPEYRKLFSEIPRIKAFAENRLLLKKSENYTGYYKTSQPGVSFVVTASPKDELKAHTWWFPIVGSVPYKGYFNKEDAEEQAEELRESGLDTWIFAAPAYSTLGWFKDPVTTPMIRRGSYYLTSTIIHELTHVTFFVPGAEAFNEQLASFVGKTGALLYLKEVRGLSESRLQEVREQLKHSARFSEMVRSYLPRFQKLYAQSLAPEVVQAQRTTLFDELEAHITRNYPQLPLKKRRFNNARLLQYRRYTPDSPVIRKIWQDSGENWGRFWELIRAYADDIHDEDRRRGRAVAGVVENYSD